jgi:hypothetical protein
MARTIEEIKAQLLAEYPKREYVRKTFDADGVATRETFVALPGEPAYDDWLTDSAQNILDQEIETDAETARRTLRQQVRTAVTQLQAGRAKLAVTNADRTAWQALPAYPAATQAQKAEILRVVSDELLQDVLGIINTLIGRGVIEEEE